MREDIKKTGETLLLFYVLFMMLSSIITIFAFDFMQESAKAFGMTAGIVVALFMIFKWWRTDLSREVIFRKASKKMNMRVFILAILFLFGVQFLFSILSIVLEEMLRVLGLSIESQLQSAQGVNQPPIQLIYTLFFGPIAEEIMFRGVIFQGLRKYGRSFAILASALLFGIYHGNLLQGIFAFVIGILFAYLTEEYSICWSIMVHIFNNINTMWINYGFVYLKLDFLTNLYDIIYAFSFVVSVVYLYKNRKRVLSYARQYPDQKGAWKCLFQNGCVVIFIGLNLITAVSGMV